MSAQLRRTPPQLGEGRRGLAVELAMLPVSRWFQLQVRTLEGGYRSYRRWCKTAVGQKELPAPAPVVVLGGCTGVGKTAVLHELRAAGEQFLDLEVRPPADPRCRAPAHDKLHSHR